MADEHPFDLFLGRWRERGGRPRVNGDQARGLCPYHRDTRPSLNVKRREHDILFNCFFCGKAGKSKILQSLGLTMRDLFVGPARPAVKSPIIAEYNYRDRNGSLIFQKVRTASKDFWFRRPDSRAKGGWRNDLEGVVVGPYRINEVLGRTVIFVTEGERAVNRLWDAGLAATCGPFGATRWTAQWSKDLRDGGCRELVVLADNDPAGLKYAESVARITSALNVDGEVAVKVVQFTDLAKKADVVDFLEGHGIDELLRLVAATFPWSPESAEQGRLNRRRILTRQRVRRHRERARASFRSVTEDDDNRGVTLTRRDIRSVTQVTPSDVTPVGNLEKWMSRRHLPPVTQSERTSNTLLGVSARTAHVAALSSQPAVASGMCCGRAFVEAYLEELHGACARGPRG